jgi:D-arabinono-1,4-lactone oxidase
MADLLAKLLEDLRNDPSAAERHSADELLAAVLRARAPGPPQAQWAGLAKRAGDVAGVSCQSGILRAKSEDDVVRLVEHARREKLRLRTIGAGHSVATAIGDTDAAVDDLVVVLDGDLRGIEITESTADGRARVRVGGGCNLGINPSDPTSTPSNSLCLTLASRGYALPILGGISHQTVAGFLQTGSSGGSLCHGMSDVVVEMEIIDGLGNKRVLREGTDELHAAAVSMGLFGVVTSVTLDLERDYVIEGTEENVPFEDSLLARGPDGKRRLTSALRDVEYLHVNWFPQKHVRRVMQWKGTRAAAGSGPIVPYENTLRTKLVAGMAAVVLELESALVEIDAESEAVQLLIGFLMRRFLPLGQAQSFRDTWHHALPTDDQVAVDTIIKTFFTEIWLPAESTDRVLDVMEDLFRDRAAAGNFATEIYGAKRSKFWLSMAHDRDVVRIDPYWWAHNYGTPEAYFTRFWDVLLDIPGARLHWGKYMPRPGQRCGNTTFDADYLRRMYPKLDAWLGLRRDFDPEQIFVTPYWRERLGIAGRA